MLVAFAERLGIPRRRALTRAAIGAVAARTGTFGPVTPDDDPVVPCAGIVRPGGVPAVPPSEAVAACDDPRAGWGVSPDPPDLPVGEAKQERTTDEEDQAALRSPPSPLSVWSSPRAPVTRRRAPPPAPSRPPAPEAEAESNPWDDLAEDDYLGRALAGAYEGPLGERLRLGAFRGRGRGVQRHPSRSFREATGINAVYTGSADFEPQLNVMIQGNNPPDMALIPAARWGRRGSRRPAASRPSPAAVVERTNAQFPAGTNDPYVYEGSTYALRYKTDLKSILWYNNAIFADNGYEIPDTWDGLKELSATMIADGITPWCVGIESGGATGWPFTDWMEEMVLRLEDENLYDQWTAGEVTFSDPRIVAVAEEILSVWNTDGMVYAAGGSIAATPVR